jgi:type III restriction enzyme
LTVIATESYQQFADGLQKEMEKANGGTFSRRLPIRNADDKRNVRSRPDMLAAADFAALWDRVKYKTVYRAEFDNVRLIDECIRVLRDDAPPVPRARLRWRKANLAIGREGVETTEQAGAGNDPVAETGVDLPDILTELERRTQLTRKTIQRVLSESGRLNEFKENPQAFIEIAAATLNRCKRAAIVNGIQYRRLGEEQYDAQTLLDDQTVGYARQMIEDSQHKSVYEQVLYDSNVEAEFARALELESTVKLFAKLPPGFEIPTPLGPYNPDWAVVIQLEGRPQGYFVAETKGGSSDEELRGAEAAKIKCGRAHFRALRVMEPPAKYEVVTTVQELLDRAR